MLWTEQINQISSPLKESSFLCSKEDFIKLLKYGNQFLKGAIENLGTSHATVNREVALQNFEYLQKFKNSKILIVGSGPSLEHGYNKSDYDYIWSCNSFYKNNKLKNEKIDLVTLGDDIDLSDKNLLEYLKKNNTIVCFENYYSRPIDMKVFKNEHSDKVFWAMTRYHSRIGSVPRLACLAVFLGAKEIHFIGMDGYVPKASDSKSSMFESKPQAGTIEETSDGEDEILNHYKQQYLTFWDYLLHEIGHNVSFANLGHLHACNLTTTVLTQRLGENYTEYLKTPSKRNIQQTL